MKQITGLLLFTIVLNFSLTAQKFSALEKIKLSEANTAFFASYYDEALSIYKSIYSKHTGSAFLNSRIGLSYFFLEEYDDAKEYFEMVQLGSLKKKDYDFYYGYGLTKIIFDDYNGAQKLFKDFLQKGKPSMVKLYSIESLIKQCEFAIKNKENPVSVLVESIGDSINSKYDEYHPSVSVDGKLFMFTSRREDSEGGELMDDGQYKSDIYVSKWNNLYENWGKSSPVEGAINSEGLDANGGITGDGTGMFIYKNTSSKKSIIAPTGSGDIFFSKKGSTGKWSAPKIVEGINSREYDGCPVVTPDGNKLFFVSARMGSVGGKKSIGNWDIWMSEKQSDGSWGKPQNLGPTVNTSNDERNIFIHPNGKTLFFSSDGYPEKSFGGFDIYRTDFIDGKWTEPVNLGYPINTQFHEKEFVVSTDGKVGWLVANRDFERKDYDIYQVDLKHYNVFTGESEVLSILKGRVIDFSTGLPLKTNIDIKEKEGSYSESISSNSNGNYFNTLVSNKTYVLTVSQQGYKAFQKEISINLPIKKKPKRVTSSSRRKKKKTTQTHTVELNLELERENPIEVISKDLFKTQIIAFNATESGYEINDFSKSILEMYARQQIQAPSIVLDISGHFEDVDNANMESKKLADLVINYLKSNGVPENALKVHYMGDSEPISDNDTAIGRAANRRVEIRIVF